MYDPFERDSGCFDVIVGGQYGDEGKGQIASRLVQDRRYTFSVRVGGDNAEHRFPFKGKVYTGRVLPCGWVDPSIKLFLGAGHMFHLDALLEESKLTGKKRIVIDRNAGIVTAKHMAQSVAADRSKRGGTTGQGIGKATAHKVKRDGTFKTAMCYPEIYKNFLVADTSLEMHKLMKEGGVGLLEGSQGALLSLNHGAYPYCTAKDVTPAGVIAEAGLDIHRLRDIVAIYRAFPMRVPGDSGPAAGKEMSWEEVETMLGYELIDNFKRQTLPNGKKGGYERIFNWDWQEFEKSLILCSPTAMVLTFADWICPEDAGKTQYAKLSPEVHEFVDMMEKTAEKLLNRKVKVVYLTTGPLESELITKE